ncbi:helicase-related protein [Deinococcus detaillensis]|uniref:helicase-related protein n=1 Tax=Deinococcus detaillensis TaxID=2592048 RepID=UPI00163D7B51|nr:helicase-related protein [Deinococcus detaillensis]
MAFSNLPVTGALVYCRATQQTGQVQGKGINEERLRVRFASGVQEKWLWEVSCGLQPGQLVLHGPQGALSGLGEGRVITTRTLGEREQVLVEFHTSAERRWLPWTALQAVTAPEEQARKQRRPAAAPLPNGSAERFRLRQLGRALRHWHGLTGTLAQVDIDPLPHQIHLVHRILTSGTLSWMIADDVGLGKTIEVGLLLAAARARGVRRVLLCVPAGLTRQWQQELRERFGMREAVIYGEDFTISDPAQWRLYDTVIASMDRLKAEGHLELVQQAPRWDLVVFDEAHRLTRAQYGLKLSASERYRLAQTLRSHADDLLLLTGTPHQGKLDRFEALLELLRPGKIWRERIQNLRAQPEILADMIIRNRKADVTDADGQFLFRGKVTRSVSAVLGEPERRFERALGAYLQRGYTASRNARQPGSQTSLAIGFVMTVYRKLAASSLAAIEMALRRRLARLEGRLEEVAPTTTGVEHEDTPEHDANVTGGAEFFQGEHQDLQDLIDQVAGLRAGEAKRRALLESVIPQILAQNPQERVLIFTEYRSTQDDLVAALSALGPVDVIHGGQTMEQRRSAIEHFETAGQFLVSTEAGGEGFNLQARCHILVNYDLPWNPMRLVQRVGRLYRYGQTQTVVTLNMAQEGSLDDDILTQMYRRLEAVARDLASVSGEYREGLQEDILGQLAAALDVSAVLEDARTYAAQRTQERLEEALSRAREAAKQQEALLRYASGFDPQGMGQELPLTPHHLRSFVEGMCRQLHIELREQTHAGRVWSLRLPEEVQQSAHQRASLRVTFDRALSRKLPGVQLLDGSSSLLQHLFDVSDSYVFKGHVAAANLPTTLCAELAWNDNLGRRLHQRFVAVQAEALNPAAFADFLLHPAADAPHSSLALPMEALVAALQRRLSQEASETVQPGSLRITGMALG